MISYLFNFRLSDHQPCKQIGLFGGVRFSSVCRVVYLPVLLLLGNLVLLLSLSLFSNIFVGRLGFAEPLQPPQALLYPSVNRASAHFYQNNRNLKEQIWEGRCHLIYIPNNSKKAQMKALLEFFTVYPIYFIILTDSSNGRYWF